jgi:hypothetical protein
MTFENFFFHVGMCKTGTTFVQQEVFPRWPGLRYLSSRNLEYFVNLASDQRYLISCEGFTGRMFGDIEEKKSSLARLSEMFPGARCILSVRRPGDYLSSLYSQYLRYGGSGRFHEFIALDGNDKNSFVHRDDFCFEPVIRQAERCFGAPPFVFDNNELRGNLEGLLADLATFLGTEKPTIRPGGAQPNPSLKKRQGELLRRINEMSGVQASRTGRYRPYARAIRFRMDPPRICRSYLGWIPSPPLLNSATREQIDASYRQDWEFVRDYIKRCPWRMNLPRP